MTSPTKFFLFLFSFAVVHSADADSLDQWNVRTSGIGLNFYAVTYGAGRFVAVGPPDTIISSTNGEVWNAGTNIAATFLNGVAWGNNSFVAVGNEGAILTSTDAVTWTQESSPTTNHLRCVRFVNGGFIALGNNGALLASTNGLAWVARNSGSTMNLDGVAFGNGLYCAVGGGLTQNSSITRSSDGITWSNQTVSFNYLYDVTFGNGVFVVQGIRGQIRTSSDAVNWTLFQGDGGYLYDATFAQGYFVAGGAKLFGSQKIVTSTDGLTWISRPLDTNLSSPIRGVAYGNGYFVAVGEKGLILQSDPIFRLTAGNTLTRRDWILTGETGRSYRFQFSEDLGAKWIDLTNFMSTAETTLLHDPAAIDTPTRFYRVISP